MLEADDPISIVVRNADGSIADSARCPKCNSPKKHLHPAMQFEGEVEICNDPWHKSELEAQHKCVPVKDNCSGFVLTMSADLVGRDVDIDVDSIRKEFAKHFPGKPVVILQGLECQPIYLNDEAFEKAVEIAVRKVLAT